MGEKKRKFSLYPEEKNYFLGKGGGKIIIFLVNIHPCDQLLLMKKKIILFRSPFKTLVNFASLGNRGVGLSPNKVKGPIVPNETSTRGTQERRRLGNHMFICKQFSTNTNIIINSTHQNSYNEYYII